jgi:hypothetical protein
MRLRSHILIAAGVAALAVAAPAAFAITGGSLDGGAHPAVGLLVADLGNGPVPDCSGSLVSPTVFVTAAHCTGDLASARVWVSFDAQYASGASPLLPGTAHTDPQWGQVKNDSHDLAVVVLDKAVRGITPAELPTANSLSNLSGSQTFTSVGYGAYEVTNGPGGHQYLYDDVRGVATGALNSTNPSWLRISMNPSTGNGGTCYGDSGGPNFLGTSQIIAAITITGDAVCRSTNVVYRLDTESARTFLAQYVTLP